MSAATIDVTTRWTRSRMPAPATQRNPLLLLTQNGYFGAAAFIITMAAYSANAAQDDKNRRQTHVKNRRQTAPKIDVLTRDPLGRYR